MRLRDYGSTWVFVRQPFSCRKDQNQFIAAILTVKQQLGADFSESATDLLRWILVSLRSSSPGAALWLSSSAAHDCCVSFSTSSARVLVASCWLPRVQHHVFRREAPPASSPEESRASIPSGSTCGAVKALWIKASPDGRNIGIYRHFHTKTLKQRHWKVRDQFLWPGITLDVIGWQSCHTYIFIYHMCMFEQTLPV